jgi:hypothetical protein
LTEQTKPAEGIYTDEQSGFHEADAFDCDPHAETLHGSDPDDAVERHLDDLWPKVPETLTVTAFRRRVIHTRDLNPDRVIEDLLEQLDEEYGDPDEGTDPSEAMRLAATALCDVIRRNYRVWACEPVATAKVNVQAWVRENRPDWLTESPATSEERS